MNNDTNKVTIHHFGWVGSEIFAVEMMRWVGLGGVLMFIFV